jgi:hypothetical protein
VRGTVKSPPSIISPNSDNYLIKMKPLKVACL